MYTDETANPRQPQMAILLNCEIANDAALVASNLYIRLPQLDDGKYKRGPVRWSPRMDTDGSLLLPEEGMEGIVTKDDQDNYWLLQWWPYDD